ncbi:MAG: dephospho-CoA kinase [Tenericutes bacterium GWC2_34_14]|nr:MAG: dephospho-CoA kinase [Tenericutes bacterium GWC2_34_14]OHE33662.1 MAG: dephospho-CoA kinase [Tenericutes bacterium GWE2_34_108]OHE36947.1 MAG: dephospho-CoA kinase [Tenericutes bacterium GWF1_35_14]OHE37973.1 MAG: dephospho-CoA kinase [Tenericutes bacterium GWF2_35_184]OHE42042.1 MAG: dephospho-CoA kinase [Tenericutes bacterium RIFOXYA12_FULL_35_10]OHE43510.1 MAG: dephospho-CoA kinase [Tenericutes bacterium RIFOXYA2_FULL_36_32]OHE46572.1 MAG: dephospho-CoA kinase [Tenericutes bacteriu
MSVKPVKSKSHLIGLTGSIGSGKTTASKMFQSLGIPVIDSDLIVKNLWKNDLEMVKEIEHIFGFQMDQIGKKRLAHIIFNDEEKRLKLNQIIHPRVFQTIEEEKIKLSDSPSIMIDMPLLFEVGYDRKVDEVVLVDVDKDQQIERIMKRDGISETEAITRIKSQMPLEEKRRLAHVILDNRGDIVSLEHQVKTYIKGLKHEK